MHIKPKFFGEISKKLKVFINLISISDNTLTKTHYNSPKGTIKVPFNT
jgi:hypothetical protein